MHRLCPGSLTAKLAQASFALLAKHSSVQRCTLPKAAEKLGVHAHSSSQALEASGLAQLSTSPCNALAAGEVNWDWTLKWL